MYTSTKIKAQIASAYLKEYRGYGCEDPAVAPFCEPYRPSCAPALSFAVFGYPTTTHARVKELPSRRYNS